MDRGSERQTETDRQKGSETQTDVDTDRETQIAVASMYVNVWLVCA